ncbi:hypothetical protein [Arsenophonus sp. PmNCSU2021_1]|uniref:type III secretion apparatus assembly chaperone SctY n=1 Tax=Arsenophonus sp. PmNCSU2021_1 TaxID=3118989 RepID=UPI002FF16099
MILDPITQNALLLQGWLALQYGQLARSQILLEALLKMAPDDYQARKMLVVVLLKLDLPEQALVHCTRLRKADYSAANHLIPKGKIFDTLKKHTKESYLILTAVSR